MSSNKPKKNSINPGHYLELMDRLHIIASNLDEFCLQHPLAENEPDITKIIESAIDKIYEAYQLVGNKEEENEI